VHTVIGIGFALLGLSMLIGRFAGGSSTAMAPAVPAFLPIWLIGAGVNLWIGVSKAGYSVREEAPIFLLVFAVPAAVLKIPPPILALLLAGIMWGVSGLTPLTEVPAIPRYTATGTLAAMGIALAAAIHCAGTAVGVKGIGRN
jgi:hypothetical protein